MCDIEKICLFSFQLKLQTVMNFEQDLGKLINENVFSSRAQTYVFSPLLIEEIPNVSLDFLHLDVLKEENIITSSDLLSMTLSDLEQLCNKNKKCIKNGEHVFRSLFRNARLYFEQ